MMCFDASDLLRSHVCDGRLLVRCLPGRGRGRGRLWRWVAVEADRGDIGGRVADAAKEGGEHWLQGGGEGVEEGLEFLLGLEMLEQGAGLQITVDDFYVYTNK